MVRGKGLRLGFRARARGLWLTKYTYKVPYWCIRSVSPLGERETAPPKGKDRHRPLACSCSVLSG